MSRQFGFAFLGSQSSYLASVTLVNQSRVPYESPTVRLHGLPAEFSERYLEFVKNRYVFNVRGHDCFAFVGEWTKETTRGHIITSQRMLEELKELTYLAIDNSTSNFRKEDLLLSLGPAPGSFFADAFRLRRYRWCNLSPDLEAILQGELCQNGYGTVYDVAMNAAGGWVLQFDKGRKYRWNDLLPHELHSALVEGRKRNATIKQFYLNHQNRDEYILIFIDGTTHVSLHSDFERPIRELIESIFSKRGKVKWNFTASSELPAHLQRQANAAYYNQRGRFQLHRSDLKLALEYFREAYHLDRTNIDYRDDYYMTLLRVRKQDPAPEESLVRFNSNNSSRIEYALMRDKMGNIEVLEKRLEDLRREAQQQWPSNEWTYKRMTAPRVELHARELQRQPQELEDSNRVSLSSGEHSQQRVSLSSGTSSKRSFVFWK